MIHRKVGIQDYTIKPVKLNTSITANTNGIILEALAYKQTGILLKP